MAYYARIFDNYCNAVGDGLTDLICEVKADSKDEALSLAFEEMVNYAGISGHLILDKASGFYHLYDGDEFTGVFLILGRV